MSFCRFLFDDFFGWTFGFAVCILVMQRPGDTLNALYRLMLHFEIIKAPFIGKKYVQITKDTSWDQRLDCVFLGYAPSNIFGVHSPNTWSLTIG